MKLLMSLLICLGCLFSVSDSADDWDGKSGNWKTLCLNAFKNQVAAQDRKPMTMLDWIAKLDEFLKISGRELLDHAGQVSAEQAKRKAELEYNRYRKAQTKK